MVILGFTKKNKGIRENDFKPSYTITQRNTVAELRKLAKKCLMFTLCDKDREGESIAWHIAEILKFCSFKRKRMVFTEITKTAIQKSFKKYNST